jgi:hypothetical protein
VCVTLVGVALIITGCGGSSSPGVASLTGSSTASSSSSLSAGASQTAIVGGSTLKFASCMRANGVPNFPDPNAQGEIQTNLNLHSPQLQAAQNRCRKFNQSRPLSHAQQQVLMTGTLVFSKCMRAHGLPHFPDPQNTDGGVVMKIHDTQANNLDPDSPAFQKASKACQADLRRASNAAGLPPLPSMPRHDMSAG